MLQHACYGENELGGAPADKAKSYFETSNVIRV